MSPSRTAPSRRFFFFLFALTLSLGWLFSPLFSMDQNIPVAHAQLTCAEPHIWITDGNQNRIQRFNSTNFAFVDTLTNADPLANPHDIKIGPDGNLYIADTDNARIVRYDSTANTFTDVVTGVSLPHGLTFDDNGHLYFTSFVPIGGGTATGRVYRADSPATATLPISPTTFIPPTDIGSNYTLNYTYEGLEFGPDGNLYVVNNTNNSDTGSQSVFRFDPSGSTGVYLSTVITNSTTAYRHDLRDIAFGPDGRLYTSEFWGDRIRSYNVDYGTGIGTLHLTQTSPRPVGIVFAPNGELLVTDFTTGNNLIRRYAVNPFSSLGSFGTGNLANVKAIAFTQCLDWGDLPDTYDTTFAEDGPRHIINENLYLGECVDADANGQPVAGATGDDTGTPQNGTTILGTPSCTDDEDGITPIGTGGTPRWLNGPGGGTVQVTWASAATNGAACLDGWIDWHHAVATSGSTNSFETTTGPVPGGGTPEYTLTDKHVVQGRLITSTLAGPSFTQNITFTVPSGYFAASGGDPINLAMRWRIYPVDGDGNCPAGGIDYTGLITGGEVEDYVSPFRPTAVSLSQNATTAPSASQTLPLVAAFLLMGLTVLLLWRRPAGVRE